MSHTPGPWKITHDYNIMKDNRGIANCGGYTVNTSNWQEIDEENKANANLIAAAPDLLEACEVAHSILSKKLKRFRSPLEQVAIDKLATAIAKTRGQ